MEELLLWRWSTAVQISSSWLIALFFVVLARSSARVETRVWRNAWLANAGALGVTCMFWFLQPADLYVRGLLLFCYMLGKTLFLGFLLQGGALFAGRASTWSGWRYWPWAAVSLSLLFGIKVPGIDVLGTTQASLIALTLLGAALLCVRCRTPGLGWFVVGMLLRGLLGAAEASAYGWRAFAGDQNIPREAGVFLAAHSSFDTGAEWVIALGCVLALAHRTLSELRDSHEGLRAAHAELTRVAERDPLTGAYNRRMLPALLARAAHGQGQLLFFDLDRFKQINDRLGHDTGDACLRRFADELHAAFPDALAIVRFAGDEFLLLLPAMEGQVLVARIERLRGRLGHAQDGVPAIDFSHGQIALADIDDPQNAVRMADMAMYRNKSMRRHEQSA